MANNKEFRRSRTPRRAPQVAAALLESLRHSWTFAPLRQRQAARSETSPDVHQANCTRQVLPGREGGRPWKPSRFPYATQAAQKTRCSTAPSLPPSPCTRAPPPSASLPPPPPI